MRYLSSRLSRPFTEDGHSSGKNECIAKSKVLTLLEERDRERRIIVCSAIGSIDCLANETLLRDILPIVLTASQVLRTFEFESIF